MVEKFFDFAWKVGNFACDPGHSLMIGKMTITLWFQCQPCENDDSRLVPALLTAIPDTNFSSPKTTLSLSWEKCRFFGHYSWSRSQLDLKLSNFVVLMAVLRFFVVFLVNTNLRFKKCSKSHVFVIFFEALDVGPVNSWLSAQGLDPTRNLSLARPGGWYVSMLYRYFYENI